MSHVLSNSARALARLEQYTSLLQSRQARGVPAHSTTGDDHVDKLKEAGDLITTITATVRSCKDAYRALVAYQRYPLRLVYSLHELQEETTQLRYHVATLDNLTAELCATCISSAEFNGTPAPLVQIQTHVSPKEDPDGKITA